MGKIKVNIVDGACIDIQTWRLQERRLNEYVSLDCGLDSNRVYNLFVIARSYNPLRLYEIISRIRDNELMVQESKIRCCETDYIIIKLSSFNKIVIDKALDYFRDLGNTQDLHWIKTNEDIWMSNGSDDIRSVFETINAEIQRD